MSCLEGRRKELEALQLVEEERGRMWETQGRLEVMEGERRRLERELDGGAIDQCWSG